MESTDRPAGGKPGQPSEQHVPDVRRGRHRHTGTPHDVAAGTEIEVPPGLLTEPLSFDVDGAADSALDDPALNGPAVNLTVPGATALDDASAPRAGVNAVAALATPAGATLAPIVSPPAGLPGSMVAASPRSAPPSEAIAPQEDDDDRPVYRVAVFGLGARFHRLLGLITRHAGSNRFRFELAEKPGPGEFDIAIVDMTSRGGAEVARTLRGVPRAMPVIAVGRRGSLHRRGKDDLLFDSFSSDALNVLNDAADSIHARELSEEAVAASAGRLPQFESPTAGRAMPRVLVVDQSTAVRNQVAMALRHLGVDVEGVGTLAQARDVLSMRSYDLIVIEPMQPDGNGFEFVRSLRRNDSRRRLPVVILSHRHSMLDLCKGALAGCDGYLAKPVALSTLHATVHRVLKRSWPAASPKSGNAGHEGPGTLSTQRSTTALQ